MAVLKGGSSARVPSSSKKAGGRHRLGGHDRDREGTNTAIGVLRSVAGGNSPRLGCGSSTRHGAESAKGIMVSP